MAPNQQLSLSLHPNNVVYAYSRPIKVVFACMPKPFYPVAMCPCVIILGINFQDLRSKCQLVATYQPVRANSSYRNCRR